MDHHAYHIQQRCVCQRVRAPHTGVWSWAGARWKRGGEGAGGSVTKFGGGGWAVGLADDGADTDLESEVA